MTSQVTTKQNSTIKQYYTGALARVLAQTRLTSCFIGVWTRYIGFLVVHHRPVLQVTSGQAFLWLLYEFGRVLHLNPRLRLLRCLYRGLTLLVRRFMIAALPMTCMLLLVQRHGRVTDERVPAVRPGAVEMPIDAIAVTARQPTVHHPVEEGKSRKYVDVIVEVFAVHQQLVGPIGGEVTPRLGAMVMSRGSKNASRIGASVRIIGREPFGLAEAIRRRDAALPILG